MIRPPGVRGRRWTPPIQNVYGIAVPRDCFYSAYPQLLVVAVDRALYPGASSYLGSFPQFVSGRYFPPFYGRSTPIYTLLGFPDHGPATKASNGNLSERFSGTDCIVGFVILPHRFCGEAIRPQHPLRPTDGFSVESSGGSPSPYG